MAEVSPDEAAAKAKKRKLLIVIVGGVVLAGGIGGGLAFFLSRGSSMAAKPGEGEAAKTEGAHDEHAGDKKDEGHGEKKEEGHGEKPAEGHEEKKEEGHGEKAAEGHGEKKEEGHGEKAAEGHGDKKDAKKSEDPSLAKLEGVDFGCTQTLTPFHLNLGNPLENRYVRLEIAVEYACAEETKAEVDKRMPQLRDAIISVASRKTREFLIGPDGKEQLRKEIHNRLNHYMTKKIEDVYITDILIE